MVDTTRESDQILAAARQSRDANRNGGVHRGAASIGVGSAMAKRKNWLIRLRNLAIAIATIWVGAGIAGAFVNGIGFWGVMAVVVATAIAVGIFSSFPKVKIPKRSELKQGNPKQMVTRVELWLESQREGLPPMAAALVEKMGGQLDALAAQLETMAGTADEAHPAMSEVRELVGDYIPETIDNYRKIPEHLRGEDHAGGTADARLVESLTKISGELDRVTRKLAEGAMDDLAVKSRYLDYRFGGDDLLEDASGMPDTGVPLPDLTPATTPAKKVKG